MRSALISFLIALSSIVYTRQPSLWSGTLLFRTTTMGCPVGTTEATDLAGRLPIIVTVASGEVGQTGGNDNITPAGTNSALTFTGNSVNSNLVSAGTPTGTNSGTVIADHASHTHTYTQVVNHTHGFTDLRGAATGGATTNWNISTSAADTSSTASTLLTANPSGGVATGTTAGPSAILTHSVTTQPIFAGVALGTHQHATTATGTINTPVFTGTQFDNRSAFVKVIACRVN